MSAELICVIVLGLMFVIGTWRDINMGLLGFVAAAGVGGLVLHQAPRNSSPDSPSTCSSRSWA